MARRDRDDDDDDNGKDSTEGVSLSSKDAIESGGRFGPGPAHIVTARFAIFEYKKKNARKGVSAPVLLVKYERDGEEESVPYGVGAGWKIGKNGLKLIPRQGQEGLPNNCNAMIFLTSMEEAGMPDDYLSSPDQLDDLDVVLISKPIERDFSDRADKDGKGGTVIKKLLVVDEVVDAPWEEGSGKKKKKNKAKAKPADDDEDEDEAEDDDDEADAKKKKKKAKSKKSNDDDDDDQEEGDDDDDDDDDRKPAAKSSKSSSRANGSGKSDKGKKKSDDDESDDDIDEETIEAVIDALADGPLKVDALEAKIRTMLKGNPQRIAIAARATEDDLLEQEKGWSYDAKKGRVELD